MLQVNNTILKEKSKTNVKEKLTFSSALLSISIIVVMILILVSPVKYAKSVVNGLKLFFTAVLPGLLPFMFLTKLLTNTNIIPKLSIPLTKPISKLFGLNVNSFYCFLMSIISGYPIGAKITADLYSQGKISKTEVTNTAILSSTSGPIFVIGAVGGAMLKNPALGAIIYLSNVVAVIICSILIHLIDKRIKFKKLKGNNTPAKIQIKQQINNNHSYPLPPNKPNNLSSIVTDTVTGLLVVGFFVAIFSLFIDLLTNIKIIDILSYPLEIIFAKLKINPSFAQGIMSGIIEMTNGAKILSNTITPLSLAFISFIIAFSGFSIIMQALSFLNKCPLNVFKFVLAKFFQAILTFIICLLITIIIL